MFKEKISIQSGKYVRYRVLTKGKQYYILDMDSHWYTFVLGMGLWLLPMKIYPVSREAADSILYKKGKNFQGSVAMLSIGLASVGNVLLRVLSEVIIWEIDILLKVFIVLIITGGWFIIRNRWRKKSERKVRSLINFDKQCKIRFFPSSILKALKFGASICLAWALTQGMLIVAVIIFIQYSNDFTFYVLLNIGTLLVLGFSVLVKDPISLCKYKIFEEKYREE